MILSIALGVGLGVGLAHSAPAHGHTTTSSTPTPIATPAPNAGSVWQPAAGTPWQIVLSSAIKNTNVTVPVYDIDLFDNSAATISTLHSAGRKVICYFSAGSYEDSRPDASKFPKSALGKELDGWPGEYWLRTSDPTVRSIMQSRLDMAKSKGCDGVDPDSMDGYDNDNGLGLTTADAIDYSRFLAGEAQKRGMAMGLKNAGAIINNVIDVMAWSVNEQCAQYDECDTDAAFVAKGKPVFHIEYPDDAPNLGTEACGAAEKGAKGFSTVLKTMDLDDWVVECPAT